MHYTFVIALGIFIFIINFNFEIAEWGEKNCKIRKDARVFMLECLIHLTWKLSCFHSQSFTEI